MAAECEIAGNYCIRRELRSAVYVMFKLIHDVNIQARLSDAPSYY